MAVRVRRLLLKNRRGLMFDEVRRGDHSLAVHARPSVLREERRIWSDRHPRGDYAKVAAQMSAQGFPAMDLYVSGIHAHRLGDPDIYCLLGGVTVSGGG